MAGPRVRSGGRLARTFTHRTQMRAGPAQPSPAARAAADAQQRRTAARKQIIRDLEDTIHREAHGREAETEALHAELYERLDTMDLDDDLDTLPIAEIIAALRRDLGLDPHRTTRGISPWKRRRPADVRALCARAARPSAVDRAGDRDQGPAPCPRATPARPARHRPAETLIRLPGHDGVRPDQAAFRAVGMRRASRGRRPDLPQRASLRISPDVRDLFHAPSLG